MARKIYVAVAKTEDGGSIRMPFATKAKKGTKKLHKHACKEIEKLYSGSYEISEIEEVKD